ncbi:hypothetical protein [Lactococcus lactis]|uniref:hypothetical protein n=1 Tax=Lactococcus lactis TaxID=1358 RepID=UPI00024D8F19|nr:hypothetical protein [Lactococcus lactis]BAL51564.1 hypothetical protein lilo_1567 [Lactococcus lactis subsp. lactis IO-1]
MSYDKQTWNKYDELKTEEENIENGAVVTDNRMNHMETGIGDNDANLASHLADKNNPHKVTAAQVGLDKVDNVKQASKVEFDSHTSDNSNPHKVTAAQIGLDKVDNIQQAAKTDFDSHVNNKANPHAVTASQVGAYTKTESDSKLTDLSNKVIANKGNLASGTDLDNVIDIGTYRLGGLTGGTDIINVPSERSGTTIYAYLTVSGTTTSVVQELIVYDSKTVSQIYSRSRSGSTPTFSPWSKTVMADDSGKVKLTDFEVTTISETVNIGNGLSLNFQRKGEFVLVRFSGSLTAINSGTYFSTAVPEQWRPDGIKELIGHFASGTLAFHVDLETDGRVKWWGASGATGAPRGTAMYFLK